MRGRRLNDEQLQAIKELYPTKMRIADIAVEADCSTVVIYRWAKKLGLESRLCFDDLNVRPNALARALWDENQTQKTIIGRYGFKTKGALKRALREANIPTKYEAKQLGLKVWCRLAPKGCLKCGTIERIHGGRGLCRLCYQRERDNGTLDFYITEAEMGRMYAETEEAKEIDILH